MGTIANAKVTHYYNCYNGDFIGCLPMSEGGIFISMPPSLAIRIIPIQIPSSYSAAVFSFAFSARVLRAFSSACTSAIITFIWLMNVA